MLPLLQLFIAVFAIYSAVTFEDELKFLVPLVCLFFMLLVSRLDQRKSEKATARKTFLKSEMERVRQKESTTIKDQDFFTIESLLWPKSELLLIDAIHFIFKDLGFMISTGINYSSVDRIVKIPNTKKAFGVEILMSERDVEPNHPKLVRTLQFEKERKEGEKILIVASTHTSLPLAERAQMSHLSKELSDFLIRHNISLLTAHHLYGLWQKAKGKEIDIFEFFEKIHSHRSGTLAFKGIENLPPIPYELPPS